MNTTAQSQITPCIRPVRILTAFLSLLIVLTFNAGPALAQDATSSSITLHWTSPGDDGSTGTASQYDIRYSTSLITEGNWDDAVQADGESSPLPAGSAEEFTVTGLESGTTYYFAVKTADEVPNWSDLSNVISRTTLEEDTPPAVIANLTLNNATQTSITLHWTAPGDDGTTGTASEYDIRYSTSLITEANWDAATQVTGETAPKDAGFAESFIVTGLTQATRYYFAIRTADEVPNWSELSNVPYLETEPEDTPPADIAGLAVIDVSDNSVTLQWTAPGDDGSTGTASEYDIRYSTSPINEDNWDDAIEVSGEPTPGTAGTVQTYTVSSLDMETTYYFAIKTADEVPNWSGISNVVNATTIDDIPPAAINDLTGVFELMVHSGLI